MNLNELEERLKGHVKITKSTITTPFNLQTTLNKLEEKNMNKFNNITWLKKFGTVAAVFTICAITVVSASSLKGYFKDVKNFSSAITGTEYLNATNDINVNVVDVNDEFVTLNVNITNPTEAPFRFIEELAITEYKILDKETKEILTVDSAVENSQSTAINKNDILVKLPLNNASLNVDHTYTLEISEMYGVKKADQPLKITGDWKCEFKR